MNRQHPIHVAEIDGNASERRIDLAFERRPGAERDDWQPMGSADAHDRLHLLRRCRKRDGVGRLVLHPGGGIGVLLAHCRRDRQAVVQPLR